MKFDISKMLHADVYDHPVQSLELIETHISWVVLTGEVAYKIKKPVNFGFLDFSTLVRRKHYCEQELKLNQRLTTNIYIEVVGILEQHNKLLVGKTDGIEYAIKMKQFPQAAQLDNMLAAGVLNVGHMDAIATLIADFHQRIDVAEKDSTYGTPESLYQPVEENFSQIKQQLDTAKYDQILAELTQWSESTFSHLTTVFTQRKQQGYIRECHGDMHLRNMLWLEDDSIEGSTKGPMAFDCIEFNENLRWIDVISEVAFLVMDLQDRKQFKLANRFLNSYLEKTGDYAGLSILPFYLCYRAMVRAKVAILRLHQAGLSEKDKIQLFEEFETYLKLANGYSQLKKEKLIIMRGVSASGKSTVSQLLVDELGAIRLRSDVERKRLMNVDKSQSASDKINTGLYSQGVSEKTYARLLSLASQVITSGFTVIVDAAFLKHQQRKDFQALAERLAIQYIIVEMTAPEETLKQRIVARKNDVSDADLEVLEFQLNNWTPLHTDEVSNCISTNVEETENIVKKITKM